MPDGAERKRRSLEAARRREAATTLRTAAVVADYASRQLQDGLTPEQAREAAMDAAAALEGAARSIRRSVRWRPGQRRTMARLLASRGMPTGEIALRLGVCKRTVRSYVQQRG